MPNDSVAISATLARGALHSAAEPRDACQITVMD
jgi:hypothetical protein